jgi:hypothetical protein
MAKATSDHSVYMVDRPVLQDRKLTEALQKRRLPILGSRAGKEPLKPDSAPTVAKIDHMPTVDLTDEEYAAVTAAVRRTIDEDRYPLSPRLNPLKSALEKLDPASASKPKEPRPPLPEAPTRSRGRRMPR